MPTELSRRDALTALAAAGITSTAGCAGLSDGNESDESPMETLVGLADVLYPSEVDPTEDFIEAFMFGRITAEEAYREELTSGIETLDALADEQFGSPFLALSDEDKVALFDETELRTGDSVADGSDIERLNYHLIDELLFAFYASPTGGELVGNPNPRGYPGGYGHSPVVEQ